jgi:hypothetical protein
LFCDPLLPFRALTSANLHLVISQLLPLPPPPPPPPLPLPLLLLLLLLPPPPPLLSSLLSCRCRGGEP